MSKLTRVKPVSEGLVRVSLGFSVEDYRIAAAFQPESVIVYDEKTPTKIAYTVSTGPAYIGERGIRVPEKIEDNSFFVNVADTVENTALLARAAKFLPVLEKQITAAKEEYEKARKAVGVEE